MSVTEQVNIGFAKETNRGVPMANATRWIPRLDFAPEVNNDYAPDKSATGVMWELKNQKLRHQMPKDKFALYLNPDYMEPFFYFFGQVASAQSGTTGAYTHTATPLMSVQGPTYTYFYERNDVDWRRRSGQTVNDIELTSEAEGETICTVNAMGRDDIAATAQTPSYDAQNDRQLLVTHAKAYHSDTFALLDLIPSETQIADFAATTAVTLNATIRVPATGNLYRVTTAGTTAASAPTHTTGTTANGSAQLQYIATEIPFKKAGIKLNKNAKQLMTNGLRPFDVRNTKYEGEMSLSIFADSVFFDDLHMNGTDKAVKIRWEDTGAANLGTSTLKPLVEFDIAPTKIEVKNDYPAGDHISADLTMKIRFDRNNNNSVRCRWQNTIVSY